MSPDENIKLVSGDFPRRITLEITNRCNLSCTFCPRKWMPDPQGNMDVKMAKGLIDEMTDKLPVTLVPFFRGEPLLHPDWIEIILYAKKKGLGPIQFTTNAALMDQKASEAIIDAGIDFISFSMDTIDPILYERTRRGAVYEKVLRNILCLLDLREKRGSRFPEIQVSAVETSLHRKGMDAFVDFWRSRVDKVRVYVEHSVDGHPGSIPQELPTIETRLPCKKVFEEMVIYWNGEVALCNHDWMRSSLEHIGTVSRENIFWIWKNSRYAEIRKSHLTGNVLGIPPCDHCDHWQMFYLPSRFLGKCYEGDKNINSVTTTT